VNEVRVIFPPASLVEGVLHLLISGGKEFDQSIVVFPGKRPAHFLRKAIAERVGSSYLPPRIFSMETFLEFLAASLDPQFPGAIGDEDAAVLLFEIHQRGEYHLTDARYNSFDAFLPIGLKLFSELEEMMFTNLPVEKVQSVLHGIEFPRFRTFGRFFDEFYREVKDRGLQTRAMLYRSVAEEIESVDLTLSPRVVLAGLYALTVPERIIVRSLVRRENVHLIVQDGVGLDAQLEHVGVTISRPPRSAEKTPRLHYYEAPDTHGQVFALAAELRRQHSKEGLDERTAVVLPAAELLFPVVQHALPFLSTEEFNISLGYPLSRTPVYAFLKSILDLVSSMQDGKCSVSAYLRFILHPYTKNIRIQGRSDVTRILFHTIEEHLSGSKSKLLVGLGEIENDPEVFEGIAARLQGIEGNFTAGNLREHCATIHRETIGKFLKLGSVGDFAQRSIQVLEYIFEESTARQHPLFRPYVERTMELLQRCSESLAGSQKLQDASGFAEFLRYAVGTQTVPFSGTPLQGLQVLGLLETRNLTFDTVYLLDATDDILPGGQPQDLLLPYQVRRMFGLQTSRDRELLKENYVDLLIRSAKEVHVFYTSNNRKEKSRFIHKLQWQSEQAEKKVSKHHRASVVRYKLNLSNATVAPIMKTSPATGFLRDRFRFTATSLNTYLACPLMFYYRYILGLEERDEVTDEIESADVGSLVHTILREYFAPLVGKVLSPEMFRDDRLSRVIEQCFHRTFGDVTSGAVYLLKEQVRHQLGEFLEKYQIPVIRDSCIITALEQTLTIEENGYRFSGRIDRVESRGKNIMILDYKTGGSEEYSAIDLDTLNPERRETWAGAISSFQLPLYMLLYSNYFKRNVEEIHPAILFLGKQPVDSTIEFGLGSEEHSVDAVYHAVKPIIFKLIDEISDSHHDFVPTENMEEHCPRCPYTAICGTQWIQRRDKQETRR